MLARASRLVKTRILQAHELRYPDVMNDRDRSLLLVGALATIAYYAWKKALTPTIEGNPAPAGVDPGLWQLVLNASGETDVPPNILGGVISAESNWGKVGQNSPENAAKCGVNCANSSCAAGFTQMKKAAVEEVGGYWQGICDPANGVLWGARYLKKQYDRFGDWNSAIAAYHIGPGAVASGRADTSGYVATVNSRAGRYGVSGFEAGARFRLFSPRAA